MSAGWVAVSVRAGSMTRSCLDRDRARALAASPKLQSALAALNTTQYRHQVQAGQTLAQAQRAVTSTLLWNLRVLAGWAPRHGVTVLRALAGEAEISNVVDHLQRLAGSEAPPPYQLGGLATTWPRLSRTASSGEVRSVLATSPWGDPGGSTPDEVGMSMRASLYDRLVGTPLRRHLGPPAPHCSSWPERCSANAVGFQALPGSGLHGLSGRPPCRRRPWPNSGLRPLSTRGGCSPASPRHQSFGKPKHAGGPGWGARRRASRGRRLQASKR